MAKYSRSWNENVYKRYMREGRGQGTGINYKPWLTVRDFPSQGIVSRVKSDKTGRVYHLMSSNETRMFYLLDWLDEVLDIKEQYPLELCDSIKIAESAQIRYPYDNKSGFPYVLTSDFNVETTEGTIVLSVKPASELKSLRVREKLEIERRYWASRNVQWELVTEHEINQVKAQNIEWLSLAKDLKDFGLCDEVQSLCKNYFLMYYETCINSLSSLFYEIEHLFGLSNGMGLNIYKHLVYRKIISVDICQTIDYGAFSREPTKLVG